MRFIYTAAGMVEEQEAVEASNWALDKFNNFSDWVIGKEVELILAPIGSFFKEVGVATWHWFITNLPDIMGYSAVLAAICIILGAMFGRGGMMKPLAIYAAALILALCILGGV
jgi:hypothetical protein